MNATIYSDVYLHFVNREIHHFYSIPINPTFHRAALKFAFIFSGGSLFCGAAQAVECYADLPDVLSEFEALSACGYLRMVTAFPQIDEFFESRRELYFFERGDYPMYFDKSKRPAISASFVFANIPTTQILKASLASLSSGAAQGRFLSSKSLSDPGMQETLRHLSDPSDTAGITPRRLRHAASNNLSKLSHFSLGRELVAMYNDIYEKYSTAVTFSNFPFFRELETKSGFPLLDWNLVESLAVRLGWLPRHTQELWNEKFLRSVNYADKGEFLRAYDQFCRGVVKRVSVSGPESSTRARTYIRMLPDVGLKVPSGGCDFRVLTENLASLVSATRLVDSRFAEAWEHEQSHHIKAIIVLTATDLEDRILVGHLSAASHSPPFIQSYGPISGSEYDLGVLGRVVHVRTSAGTAGTHGALASVATLLARARPSFVVSIGICFGLKQKVQNLGDVAVSDSVFEYDRQRVTGSTEDIEPRGDKIPCSSDLVSLARALSTRSRAYKVHVGGFSSGDKLIDSGSFKAKLLALNPQGIAGDMEGAGVASACKLNEVPFVLVKGICDWAEGKNDDFQEVAMQNSVSFAFELLKNLRVSR